MLVPVNYCLGEYESLVEKIKKTKYTYITSSIYIIRTKIAMKVEKLTTIKKYLSVLRLS